MTLLIGVFVAVFGANEAVMNDKRYMTTELSDGTVVYMQVANTDDAGKKALARVEQRYMD